MIKFFIIKLLIKSTKNKNKKAAVLHQTTSQQTAQPLLELLTLHLSLQTSQQLFFYIDCYLFFKFIFYRVLNSLINKDFPNGVNTLSIWD